MTYDWKALAPARPLSVADVTESGADSSLYVLRADAGAAVIAPLLDAGLDQPIAIFGPAGSGKSTELSALARVRQRSSIAIVARLDHLIVVDESTTERETLDAISRLAVDHATRRVGLVLPGQLTQYAELASLGEDNVAHGEHLLRLALREIAAASAQRSVTPLIDGLERDGDLEPVHAPQPAA